jgi:hypothetical protein
MRRISNEKNLASFGSGSQASVFDQITAYTPVRIKFWPMRGPVGEVANLVYGAMFTRGEKD